MQVVRLCQGTLAYRVLVRSPVGLAPARQSLYTAPEGQVVCVVLDQQSHGHLVPPLGVPATLLWALRHVSSTHPHDYGLLETYHSL